MSHALHDTTPAELMTRLRRVEGQVRGLQHMIERGDRCIDVLTQIAATRAALTAVGRGLLDCEIRHALQAPSDADETTIATVLTAVDLLAGR